MLIFVAIFVLFIFFFFYSFNEMNDFLNLNNLVDKLYCYFVCVYPNPTSRHIITIKPTIVPHVASKPLPLEWEREKKI